ncbi:hypothetical protein HPP92_008263 [Vanilla planifolia]|uniref:Transcription initiation factor TFIID subunit 8 n=1 Tax=Vanilla planifolia TaxID=51239 RepID=A0A835R8J0_VANPL|nr:hypothetical protein HPP92_008263 [Vanilla planifolia]
MSDRGKQGGADNENNSKKSKQTGCDDFGRAVSRIAVAQICESAGLQSSQRSALDALADVTIQYICCLGKAANFYANLSGRTECSIFDVIQALEDLVGSSQGFSGASNVQRCIVGSGVIQDIYNFVSTEEEFAFSRPIPRFPVTRSLKHTPSFAQRGSLSASHVPDWLPAFPDPHTYVHTPVWNQRTAIPRTDKLEQAKQRRKAERSLLSLHQRIEWAATAGSVPVVDLEDVKGKHIAENNPYLVPPWSYDVKNTSVVTIPKDDATMKCSVLETFAPAIEAAKTGSLECGDSKSRLLPNKMAPVHFRIGADKKSVAVPLSSGAFRNGSDSLVLKDDQKDDKKRRAELILKEAMENPHELIQL